MYFKAFKKGVVISAKLTAILLLSNTLALSQALYLPLPDGSSLKLRPGETPAQGWARAQQMYPEAFVRKIIPDEKKYDVDYLNKCKLEATRTARTDLALNVAMNTCRTIATPKKCRNFEIQIDMLGNESGDSRIKCVEECKNANYFSKKFGECSTG